MDNNDQQLLREIAYQLERIANALAPKPQAQARGLFQTNAVLHDDKCEINFENGFLRCNCKQRNEKESVTWQNVAREMGVPEQPSPCAQQEPHPSHEWSDYVANRLVSFRCHGAYPERISWLRCDFVPSHPSHRWIVESETPTYARIVFCDGAV